jgi:hypothetical protein
VNIFFHIYLIVHRRVTIRNRLKSGFIYPEMVSSSIFNRDFDEAMMFGVPWNGMDEHKP